MVKEFILQNWIMILILTAFAVLIKTTGFIERKTVRRTYILIVAIFVLSVIVFLEFYFDKLGTQKELRTVLMAIRYSSTPFIIAMILFTLARKKGWQVFIPAIVAAALNFVSVFTGIVFSIKDDNTLQRGIFGYVPFIAVGLYSALLVYTLLKQSNKRAAEIIPIVYLTFSFASGLVLPFVLGKDYSYIFCPTIAVALFVYYDFLILQLTKKDVITGLLNRHAFETDTADNSKTITAIVSIDMNGLKTINDTYGHAAGDEALETVALCFIRATKPGELAYRVGGDEFMIVCRKIAEEEVKHLTERIQKNVAATKYSCAVGYSYSADGTKTIDEMIKESDEIMYSNKEKYYLLTGKRRDRG